MLIFVYMKLNKELFEYSINNKEDIVDYEYAFIERNPELSIYVEKIKQLKKNLITISTLEKKFKNDDKKNIYVNAIIKNIQSDWNEYINSSEFGCFVNACDNTRDTVVKDFESLKVIISLYIDHRDIDLLTPNNWVQAILDGNSSRRKGGSATNKLTKKLKKYNYIEVQDWDELINNKLSFGVCTTGKFNLKILRDNLNIRIETKSQEKNLDFVIKHNENYFLLEAKHINVSGGAQDKQIKELIGLISLTENNKKVSYLSFMDGKYSNKLLLHNQSKRSKKKYNQLKEINININKTNNFWLNTKGFDKFLEKLNGK